MRSARCVGLALAWLVCAACAGGRSDLDGADSGADVSATAAVGGATASGAGGAGVASGGSSAAGPADASDAGAGAAPADAHGIEAAADAGDCPPIAPSISVPQVLATAGSVAELYAADDGLVAQVFTMGYRGSSCGYPAWIPYAAPTAASLGQTACSSFGAYGEMGRAWGDWAWVAPMPGNGLIPYDLRQSPPAAGDPVASAESGDFAVGPGGLVHATSDRSALLRRADLAGPSVTIASFEEVERPTALEMAVGGSEVFVVAHTTGTSSRLLRVPLEPGAVVPLGSIEEDYCCGHGSPALGGGFAYLGLTIPSGYELRAVDLATGALHTVATFPDPGSALSSITADDEFVYFWDLEQGTIKKRRHCGGEAVVVASPAATGSYYPSTFGAMAAGGHGLYWQIDAQIYELKQP